MVKQQFDYHKFEIDYEEISYNVGLLKKFKLNKELKSKKKEQLYYIFFDEQFRKRQNAETFLNDIERKDLIPLALREHFSFNIIKTDSKLLPFKIQSSNMTIKQIRIIKKHLIASGFDSFSVAKKRK